MHTTRRTCVPSRPAARAALIALLAMAMLLATAAGLRHRISHARPATAGQAADDAAGNSPAAAHSCLAYDAATLAERLPAAAPMRVPAATPARPRPSSAPLPHAHRKAIARLARGPPLLALP